MTWSIAATMRSPLDLVEWTRIRAMVVVCVPLRAERLDQQRSGAWIHVDRRRYGLVRDQLRLGDHPHAVVDRLDLVQHRGDRSLGERHEPDGRDANAVPRRRVPLHLAAQDAVAQVEHPLVRAQVAVADVERLVVDEQADRACRSSR